jgi:hypothetical protein
MGRLVLDHRWAGRAFGFGMVAILAGCQDKNVPVARPAARAAIASKWQPRHLAPERRGLRYSATAAPRRHNRNSCSAMFTASMHSDLLSASSFRASARALLASPLIRV